MKKSLRQSTLALVEKHRNLGSIAMIARVCVLDKDVVTDMLEVLCLSAADQRRYLDGSLTMKEVDRMTIDLQANGRLFSNVSLTLSKIDLVRGVLIFLDSENRWKSEDTDLRTYTDHATSIVAAFLTWEADNEDHRLKALFYEAMRAALVPRMYQNRIHLMLNQY